VLTSFAGAEETIARTDDYPRRIYVLVRLSCPSNGGADMMSVSPAPRASVAPDEAGIEVLSVHPVPYISTRSSRAPSHPRLQNVPGGVAIAVHFGDAVAFCATGYENTYADFLSLKGDGDRVLGVGTANGGVEGEVLVLTAGTMLRVVLDGEKILSFDPKSVVLYLMTIELKNSPIHLQEGPC
jgi:nuclear pore complex protein Nup133